MTTISQPGNSTIYIQQTNGNIQYSLTKSSWTTISSWPVTITNTNTNAGLVVVQFLTDITLDSTSKYFDCGSSKIQFGIPTLNSNGLRPTITITANNYDGLIQNGTGSANGYDNILVFNLLVDGTGKGTQIGAGWIGKKYFGKGATTNYFVNCSSKGDINGGGIVGDYAGTGSGATITLSGCSSTGAIGDNAGGIVGAYAGQTSGSVICDSCWSTGAIQGGAAGGIIGHFCFNVSVTNCYSEGNISGLYDGGGIVSDSAGQGANGCTISNCYSLGTISEPNGGICGAVNAPGGGTCSITITNCFSTGSLSGSISSAGAIIARVNAAAAGNWSVSISNCYASGDNAGTKGYIVGNQAAQTGSDAQAKGTTTWSNCYSEKKNGSSGWNDTNTSVLTGRPSSHPGVGTNWISLTSNTGYLVKTMGTTPYSTTSISGFSIVRTDSASVTIGNSTNAALRTGLGYAILQTSGGNSNSYSAITINSITGVISTSSSASVGTYTLIIYNTGSYNITTFTLTIQDSATSTNVDTSVACCSKTLDMKGLDYTTRGELLTGSMILTTLNKVRGPIDYTDMIRIKQALNQKR